MELFSLNKAKLLQKTEKFNVLIIILIVFHLKLNCFSFLVFYEFVRKASFLIRNETPEIGV